PAGSGGLVRCRGRDAASDDAPGARWPGDWILSSVDRSQSAGTCRAAGTARAAGLSGLGDGDLDTGEAESSVRRHHGRRPSARFGGRWSACVACGAWTDPGDPAPELAGAGRPRSILLWALLAPSTHRHQWNGSSPLVGQSCANTAIPSCLDVGLARGPGGGLDSSRGLVASAGITLPLAETLVPLSSALAAVVAGIPHPVGICGTTGPRGQD